MPLDAPVRPIGPDETLVFSQKEMLGSASYDHVVVGPGQVFFIGTIPALSPPFEEVLPVPRDAVVWIVDTICALLLPSAVGGIPDDVFAVNLDRQDAPLRLRRSAQIGGPGEQGFTLFHRGMRGAGAGFLSTAWSDRLLFDGGLYPCLRQLASEWSTARNQPGPRKEAFEIRPNWMGRSPAETPPPAQE